MKKEGGNRLALVLLLAALSACRHGAQAPGNSTAAEAQQAAWLVEHSMLWQAQPLARSAVGTGEMWQHPYALPQPRAAAALAPVWFTAYPGATLTPQGRSVLSVLADEALWKTFQEIGIQGMHTGPMKRAGGLVGRTFTPTVDGYFDRISFDIDPALGTTEEYRTLTAHARAAQGVVVGDIIPGHSGKGADFRLAERAYQDYPGLYNMVQISKGDWPLLPPVPEGKDSANLKPETVDQLTAKGYLVGRLQRTLFYEPGVKESDWSATPEVRGVDGVTRRWVYLHYFKAGQPTYNWLDPTFAVQRLVAGDALHSLRVLGEGMLRLDANGFLGIEKRPKEDSSGKPTPAWSEGHPLSVTSNQLIAGLIRKLGAYSFQELNLTLDDLHAMSQGGADLSYDFVSRPAYAHALVMGDTEFLRLMLREGVRWHIAPGALIHALQNHDELTLELVHFWFTHRDDTFSFRGRTWKGSELRELIRREMHERLLAPHAPYNLKAPNGVSCTLATLSAAALGISDLTHLTPEQRAQIQRAHLLLAAFNALQPGVFALSGWDLVGALTLPPASVQPLLADGDTRWINRGAYDLLGIAPGAERSTTGIPRAPTLYGSLPEQLKDAHSFVSRLKQMLEVRRALRLPEGELLDVPPVKSRGLLLLVHRLPDHPLEVTALNFSQTPVTERVPVFGNLVGREVVNALTGKTDGNVGPAGVFSFQLEPLEAMALVVMERSCGARDSASGKSGT
jgi:trehalose synthase